MRNLINIKFFQIVLIAIDVGLVHLGYILAFWFRYLGEFPEANFPSYVKLIPWISLLAVILFLVYGLYNMDYRRWIDIFVSIIWVSGFILAGNTALSFMLRQFAFPRTVLALGFLFHLILLSLWRYGVWNYSKKAHGRKHTVVIGNLKEAQFIAEKIEKASPELYYIFGMVVPNNSNIDKKENYKFPVLGKIENFAQIIEDYAPRMVFLCPDLSKDDKIVILNTCVKHHCEINLIPDFYEVLVAQARVHQVVDFPVLYMNNFMLSFTDRIIKRLVDFSIALAGLLMTLPIMLIIALCIKVDSKGPVLFKQERVGKEGRIFYLYKFRTMVHDAEKLSGPVLSSEDDRRVTRVGRVLRHTRLDELPQFFNVIKGEMSIIGPRPERPFFVEQFNESIEGYDFRHQLTGGITGLAQVSGKYSTTAEDKLRFDLLYTKNYSPLKDLQILFHTLKVLLIKDKAS
ncbi:MAG TPA: sugar transferase [Clostridia bacterium]|nr:sugar transferase [Clostridia bacterium]